MLLLIESWLIVPSAIPSLSFFSGVEGGVSGIRWSGALAPAAGCLVFWNLLNVRVVDGGLSGTNTVLGWL